MFKARICRFTLCLLALFASTTSLAQTRQVEDASGTKVTVPANPQRIVTLGEVDLDVALALGIAPVGATDGRGQSNTPRYLKERITDATQPLGVLGNPSLETLLELQPDLILTGPASPEQLAILNAIAPTALSYNQGEPWKESTLRIGNILNREAEIQQLLERYDERVALSRERLSEHQGESISIVRWNPKGPSYMLNDSFGSIVTQDLGLVRPEHQRQEGFSHSLPLSLESLDMLDGDWLAVGTLALTGDAVDAMRQAEATPMFQQMSAVKNGRYATVDGSVWTSAFGPLAAQQIIEDIEALLLGNQP